MQHTLTIKTSNGLTQEFSYKLDGYSDLARLAKALLRRVKETTRVIPEMADAQVVSISIKPEQEKREHKTKAEVAAS